MNEKNNTLNVTSFEDLQKYTDGSIIQLPDFGEGQPFIAKVKRPSLLVLAKQGKIPNSLLTAAGQLFKDGNEGLDADDIGMLSDMYDLCHIMAEATLVSPTLQEIESVGLSLTDEQLMAIFNYSQVGNNALESFRKK